MKIRNGKSRTLSAAMFILLTAALTLGGACYGLLTANSESLINTFSAGNRYVLNMDPNGGMAGSVDSMSYIGDTTETTHSFTLPADDGQCPERFGYEFLGWSEDKADDTATYNKGQDVSFTAETGTAQTEKTLYAVWQAKEVKLVKGYVFNSAIKGGAEHTAADSNVTKVVFGDKTTYGSEVSGVEGTAVDLNGEGICNAYRVSNGDGTFTVYVLTEVEEAPIYANADSGYMFYNMKGITSIEGLDKVDTSSTTDMQGMFEECKKITTLDVGDFNTSNVTTMYRMFWNCYALTALDVSGFDTSNVTNMDGMFHLCTNVAELDVSNFSTSKVKTMHYMFFGCRAISKLDVSSFDTSNVTNMGGMFHDCGNLVTIYASDDFVTTKVTESAGMFNLSYKLVGGNGTKYNYVVDKTHACIDRTATPGYFTGPSVTLTDGISFNRIVKDSEAETDVNTDVTKIVFGDMLTYGDKVSGVEGIAVDQNGEGLCKAYRVPEEGGKYTVYVLTETKKAIIYSNTDSSYMFAYMQGLASVEGMERIETTKSNNMQSMFRECQSLTTLDLAGFDTSKVTSVSNMFQNCGSLKELDLSNFNTSLVTNMRSVFQNCRSLNKLDISNFDTSNVNNMNSMFFECNSLTELNLSNFDTSNVTNMNQMFYNCRSLYKLDIRSFKTQKVSDMNMMFDGCSGLEELDVSSFNTSNVITMARMFGDCHSLMNVDVSGFDTSKVTTMSGMFGYCSKLTELDVSSFDTTGVVNMTRMFGECVNLTTIYASDKFITDNVTTSEDMFRGCVSIIGGNGTEYNYVIDRTYACIDRPETPGYFTDIADKPFTEYLSDVIREKSVLVPDIKEEEDDEDI